MKSIKGNNQIISSINSYVSDQLKDSLGIVVLSVNNNAIEIGAINPEYDKLKDFVKDIEKKFSKIVSIKQISSDEWRSILKNENHQEIVEGFAIKNGDKVKLPEFENSFKEQDKNLFSLNSPIDNNLERFDFFETGGSEEEPSEESEEQTMTLVDLLSGNQADIPESRSIMFVGEVTEETKRAIGRGLTGLRFVAKCT